jgi:Uma2 family endonuclease
MTTSPPRARLARSFIPELEGSYRFSVEQYEALTASAILTEDEPVEMLDGYVLFKLDHITLPPPNRFYPRWRQLRPWTLAEYRRMVDLGILTPDDKLELIDGYLVLKMPQKTPHRSSQLRLTTRLPRHLPTGWVLMSQCPLELNSQSPEPDGAILRGADSDYDHRIPTATDCGLVVEVSDTSLRDDRRVKCALYAEAGIPTYWIVNVDDRVVEVYTQPTGPTATPGYATRTDFTPGQAIPLTLDGQRVANIPVADLLP